MPDSRLAVADLITGLLLVLAGAVPRAPRQRAAVASVGLAWLLGSLFPAALALHQTVLALAALTAPDGRLWDLRGRVVAVLALLGGAAVLAGAPPVLAAAVFAAVAAVRWRRPASLVAALIAAAAAGLAPAVSALWPERYDPGIAVPAYDAAILLAVAVLTLTPHRRIADRLAATGAASGLDGIAAVLSDALGDPRLEVRPPGSGGFEVADETGPVAAVISTSPGLADPVTREAVAAAVRLAATNVRLRTDQRRRIADVEAARLRLLAARDNERERAAAELRADVDTPLGRVLAELAGTRAALPDGDAAAAIDVVLQELHRAAAEIGGYLAGAPPVTLGRGRLAAALAGLPAPGTRTIIEVTGEVAADALTETALFYVASEGLANVAKHGGTAAAVRVRLRRRDDLLELSVSDDGPGGADAGGSGLQGLADRMAAVGGRLEVQSRPGAGTTLTASAPISRSSATVSPPTADR